MDTINSIILQLFAAVLIVTVLIHANNLTDDDDEPHTPAAGLGA
jgi:hypothetical protein